MIAQSLFQLVSMTCKGIPWWDQLRKDNIEFHCSCCQTVGLIYPAFMLYCPLIMSYQKMSDHASSSALPMLCCVAFDN